MVRINTKKNKKTKARFIKFDIVEFYPFITEKFAECYPSITEKLFDNAVSYAQILTTIPDDIIHLYKQAKKCLLFNEGNLWMKKVENALFDVTLYVEIAWWNL